MEIEYIGKLLPDGHISVDPSVLPKIKKGEKLRIKIEPIRPRENEQPHAAKEADPATDRILSRLANAPRLGRINGELRREDIYEDKSDDQL